MQPAYSRLAAMPRLTPITPANFAAYRDARLRALLDSPAAFGSTFEQQSKLTDDEWRAKAAAWNDGARSAAWLAWDDDNTTAARGLIAVFLDEDDPSAAWLVSMWVAPQARRHGVGRLLVEVAADWAASRGVAELRLHVTDSNAAAIAFYERLGFAATGRTEPYPNDPALLEIEMARRTAS